MSTVLLVANLVLEARNHAPLHDALVQKPNQVAQHRHLPSRVAESAAYVLGEMPKTKEGIWM